MKIAIVSGARPQFIKLSPIIKKFLEKELNFIHIHTGQHYDKEMSEDIFDDLDLPVPDFNLNVGSASHGKQTSDMIEKLEKLYLAENIDVVLVPGDTNSTLAGALSAIKINIPVIHLEAGLRSRDWNMPEEINRILVDRISNLMICTTDKAVNNLKKEGINSNFIFKTGDTMVDAIYQAIEKINELKLSPKTKFDKYILTTLHRQENVDNEEKLLKIIDLFESSVLPIVLPLHPRTKNRLVEFGVYEKIINLPNVDILPPLGYLDFVNLEINSEGILTDSGGIQKEAFILKKPCITMRDTTEWIETLENGANRLLGFDIKSIAESITDIKNKKYFVTGNHPYGNGKAAENITMEILDRIRHDRFDMSDNTDNN